MAKLTRRALWIAALLVLVASLALIALASAPRSNPVIETTVIVPTAVVP